MRSIRFVFLSLLTITFGCSTPIDYSELLEDIQVNLDFGNLSSVIQISDSLKKSDIKDKKFVHAADSLAQIAERIGLDFPITEEEVIEQLKQKVGSFTAADKTTWENKNWLEWRMIDGKKKYFNRAASNLLLLKKFYENKEGRLQEIANDPAMIFRLEHTGEAFKLSDNQNSPVIPINMKITYSITVNPNAVPEGEKIRCWLPWPKNTHLRQRNVNLLSSSEKDYIISPDSAVHSTIYMESVSRKDIPVVFTVSYTYESAAQYFNINKIKILPYNKTSALYTKYTEEQLPQICFTENIKNLTDSITGPEENPVMIVKKIYMWFKENIPWTGALEYSVMPVIPEYVYSNRRGDCGMQTFMLMSMLRYKGVPVRWQSGWMVPPEDKNLHDWCEVYYEGTGWVPVDVSYDLQHTDNPGLKEYYMSGIDSYRIIVNDGVAGSLYPEKHYLRSEPYDFQRGEVEWKGGNLYFDKWDYHMDIEYLK